MQTISELRREAARGDNASGVLLLDCVVDGCPPSSIRSVPDRMDNTALGVDSFSSLCRFPNTKNHIRALTTATQRAPPTAPPALAGRASLESLVEVRAGRGFSESREPSGVAGGGFVVAAVVDVSPGDAEVVEATVLLEVASVVVNPDVVDSSVVVVVDGEAPVASVVVGTSFVVVTVVGTVASVVVVTGGGVVVATVVVVVTGGGVVVAAVVVVVTGGGVVVVVTGGGVGAVVVVVVVVAIVVVVVAIVVVVAAVVVVVTGSSQLQSPNTAYVMLIPALAPPP